MTTTPQYQRWLSWKRQNQMAPNIQEAVSGLSPTPTSQQAVNAAETAVGLAVPTAGIAVAAGKPIAKGIRNDNQYGVASSDEAASAAAMFNPTEQISNTLDGIVNAGADVFRMGLSAIKGDKEGARENLDRLGNSGRKIAMNAVPGVGAYYGNKEKRKAQEEAEQKLRNFNSAQRGPSQINAPAYVPPQAYYDLNMGQKLLRQQFNPTV